MFKKIARFFAVLAMAMGMSLAHADAPAYVTTALTAAQTTFTDYVSAAAPIILASAAALAGLFLIIRLVRKVLGGG